jgi:hypothetical protein
MGGACGTHGIDRKYIAYNIFLENPSGSRPFGRSRRI